MGHLSLQGPRGGNANYSLGREGDDEEEAAGERRVCVCRADCVSMCRCVSAVVCLCVQHLCVFLVPA